jgi:hypothetical protein
MKKSEIDELIRQYADSDRSDTFVSYNDSIALAREVVRLRRRVAYWKRRARIAAYGASR